MASVPRTFISDLSVGGFAPGKQPAYSDLSVCAGTSGEEALRGEILVVVKLIEQTLVVERGQPESRINIWRRLWGADQKASVDSKKRSEASEKQWRQEEVVHKGVI